MYACLYIDSTDDQQVSFQVSLRASFIWLFATYVF